MSKSKRCAFQIAAVRSLPHFFDADWLCNTLDCLSYLDVACAAVYVCCLHVFIHSGTQNVISILLLVNHLPFHLFRLNLTRLSISFFPLFAGCCIIFLCWAIGVPDWGGSGLLQLIPAAGAGHATTPAVFVGVAMTLWIIATAYGVYLLFLVRNEYNGAGGMKAAKKEATRAAAETAYDNRETIKDVAWEHRDEIKQAGKCPYVFFLLLFYFDIFFFSCSC